MIVGWQLAAHMRTALVQDALAMAVGQRRPASDVALVHHSDRGSSTPAASSAMPWMPTACWPRWAPTGDALDNAMAESFVDTYTTELIADRVWRTRSQLKLATVEWVGWYNARRLHGELGDVPPVEYEFAHALTAPSAPARADGGWGPHPTPQLSSCQPGNPVSVEPGPAHHT